MSAASPGATTAPASDGGGAISSPGSSPRIEKYELLEEIGHGGMATVYRARDRRLGRDVAVKVIHRHLRENTEVRTRFVAEARAAAKLRHPGIVDVFDVSDDGDAERYLVVELIRGTTLRRVLQQHRDMPAEVGAAIVLRLCEAVEHAHASSIIHRDIKPENVLVEQPRDRTCRETPVPDHGDAGSDGKTPVSNPVSRAPSSDGGRDARSGVVIKITDFGIAKILDAQGVTSTGQVLGSPAHMAPEQIEGGDVDVRTDVFALGVLMYECLVGHLPFEGKNPAQVLRRVLDGTYPAADRERPSVGGRWARIVAAALGHTPAERTSSAATLAEQIRVELEALGVSDPHAEVAAYLADPAAYTAASYARLVPRLVARGEAARKARDVWGAAADYNRALALAPDDLTILKRIASLNSNAQRWLLVRRTAAIVAGSAVLGLGAFGVARAMKAKAPVPSHAVGSGDPRASAAPPTASVGPVVAERPLDSTAAPRPPGPIPRIPATPLMAPPFVPSPAPAATVRDVSFNVIPKGARLYVDGVEKQGWFVGGTTFPLAVGPHTVLVTPNDKYCCVQRAKPINVKPAAPGEGAQTETIQMEFRPTVLGLAANAPPGARVSCPELGVNVGAGPGVAVRLREAVQKVTCALTAPDHAAHTQSFTLKAGEPTVFAWSE